MEPEILIELSKLLVVTILVTGVMKYLKQPAILGYILSGIIVGPFFLNMIDSKSVLEAFSELGVALLLFFVGLNLNPKVIKDVGKPAVITGVSQVFLTTSIAYFILRLIGYDTVIAFYIAISLAFSSTIIIMKLLSDKKDLESLYGRIATGFLITQDLLVIAVLLIISSLSDGANLATVAFESLLMGIGGMVVLFLLAVYVLPNLTTIIAKSQEYLLLFSLTWCFAIASAFYFLNFSIEAGALLAGMSLSVTPYHLEISSKLKPLRDFFLVLFFILLGSQMVFGDILHNIPLILFLSALVSIGNPIIVMSLMGLMGYTKRNSFLAGLTVAQISEFSLIVVALGMSVGHIGPEVLSIVTAIALVTFSASTYMILYANRIYPLISDYLSIFERKGKKIDESKFNKDDNHEILLFGYNRIGFDILSSLQKIKKKFLVIDHDPDVINKLSQDGYDCRYGDADDYELLSEINFHKAKMVISTIPIIDTNLLLIRKARESNKKVIIAVVAHQIDDAVKLYDAGATYVLMPHFLGGKHFSAMIEANRLSMNKFLKERIYHLDSLNKRKQEGHEHPKHYCK